MKRCIFFSSIFLALLFSLVVLASCGSNTATVTNYPYYDEEDATGKLLKYFMQPYYSDPYCWAYPIFLTDTWSAYYNQAEDVWLVKAYNTDDSYAGTWLVTDVIGRIQPYDGVAKSLSSEKYGIAIQPPLPPLAKWPNAVDPGSPDKCMIKAVQRYIADMTPQEVAEYPSFPEIQRLIRTGYPLDWHITYTSEWRLFAEYYEYSVIAYIDCNTDEIYVFDMYGHEAFD